MLGPDEELVAGRRPVEEVFLSGREARRLLVVPQRRQALERLVLHATSLRIPIVDVEGGTLTSLAGFDGHQGIAVVVPPRRYATIDDILARAIERAEPPLVLALDSLEDPQNVGTLLRSAEAAGVHGVVFPTHRQAPLTPAAVKASAGAVEHLLLAPVDDLAGALADLHVRGLRVAGAEADAPLTAREADLRGPLVVVVGSEGQGLGPAVRRRADVLMRIPMRGAVDSLNAAVAGSILLFEAVAQRDPRGRSAEEREALRRRPRPRPEPASPAETTAVEADVAPVVAAAGVEAEVAPVVAEAVVEATVVDADAAAPPDSGDTTAEAAAGAAATAPEPEEAPDEPAAIASSDEPSEPPAVASTGSEPAVESAPEPSADEDADLLPGGPPPNPDPPDPPQSTRRRAPHA